jgi:type IV fimbrial biogenesis protein FimT
VLTRRRHSASGFTLLEMMVTLGIFAILVALSIPSMKTWIYNAKVRAVADALQNGIRLAQSESLRRSRQIVFSLTNDSNPQAGGFTAVANGTYWSINAVPSMTDGSDAASSSAAAFIESGVLSTPSSANVQLTSVPSVSALCFNSVGRLVANGATGINGATCVVPANNPQVFNILLTGADRPLQVQVALGGQVHMCDPAKVLSSANPDGC